MANLLRPINEMKTAFDNSGIAQSMRFVAGITDQLNEKLARLQATVLEAAQRRPNGMEATAIQGALSSVEKKLEATNTSLASLNREAVKSKEVESSLKALERSVVGEIRTSSQKLGPVEQSLAGVVQDCARFSSKHLPAVEQVGTRLDMLVTMCSDFPKISEQLRVLETRLNNHLDGEQVYRAVIQQDLAGLKDSSMLLGTMSECLDDLKFGVNSVMTQCRDLDEQLRRQDGIERDVKSIKDGSVVLHQINGRLGMISTALSQTSRLTSSDADLDTIEQLFDHARRSERLGCFESSSVRMARPEGHASSDQEAIFSDVDRQVPLNPSPSVDLRRSVGVTTSFSYTEEVLSSAHQTSLPAGEESRTYSPADSALRLLSAIASQAPNSGFHEDASAGLSSTSFPPTAIAESNSASASEPASISASTPTTNRAAGSALLSGSVPTVQDDVSAPAPATSTRSKASKRNRQKWKNARPGSRRSSRIQARSEVRDDEEHERPQNEIDVTVARSPGQWGNDSSESSCSPELRLRGEATDTAIPPGQQHKSVVDTVFGLTSWFSDRKRKAQSEPETRPAKRMSNNSHAGY